MWLCIVSFITIFLKQVCIRVTRASNKSDTPLIKACYNLAQAVQTDVGKLVTSCEIATNNETIVSGSITVQLHHGLHYTPLAHRAFGEKRTYGGNIRELTAVISRKTYNTVTDLHYN